MKNVDASANVIRKSISWFSAFVALMLFQTNYHKLGMITSFASIALTILHIYNEGELSFRAIGFPAESKLIILFLYFVTFVSIVQNGLPSYYVKFSALVILFVCMSNMRSMNEKEEKTIEWSFVLSSAVYAIFVIRATSGNYLHRRISLFGTTMDPNFVGIPFVASSIILLYRLLNEPNSRIIQRIIQIILYSITIIGIFSTGSRGSFLCLGIGNVLVALYFILNQKIRVIHKIILILILSSVSFLLLKYLQSNFFSAIERMTNLSEGADNGRFDIWNESLSLWKEDFIKVLFGYGLEGMRANLGRVNHNTFIQLLAETGILGSILFGTFLAKIIRKAAQYNAKYAIVIITMLLQIFFLDALDCRVLWILLCWIEILPFKEDGAW